MQQCRWRDCARPRWQCRGMEYHVDRVELQEQPTAVVRGHVAEGGMAAFLGGAFAEVMSVMAAEGLEPAGPPFGRYSTTPAGFDVEAGFPTAVPVHPVGRVEASTLPGGPAVVVLHRGDYADVVRAYERARAWIAANDWVEAGDAWEAYLDGPDVERPRTIVHVPAHPA